MSQQTFALPSGSTRRRSERTRREGALSWLSRQRRAVVLGEPGAGKSALSRFLALAALDSDTDRTDFPEAWTDLVPIWLPFGAWARASAHGPVSVEDFLRDWFHARSADDVHELVGQVLGDGHVLMLVDGLDEYDTVDIAARAIERLEACLLGRQTPAVLTARPLGYEAIRLPRGEWAHATLQGFNNRQQREFCRFWIAWGGGEYDPRLSEPASERADQFQADLGVSPDILPLARNPLVLGVVLSAWLAGVSLPDNEAAAYERISVFLLEEHAKRRRQARDAPGALPELRPQHVKEIIAELALRIQQDHAAGFIHIDETTRFLADILEYQLGRSQAEARALSLDLIAFFRSDVGLVVERAPELLGFALPVLQEYWAATAISKRDVTQQEDIIVRHGFDPQWRHVLTLLLSIHGLLRIDGDTTSRLVNTWMQLPGTPEHEWRVLAWVADSVLGGIRLPPESQRSLTSRIIEGVHAAPFKPIRLQLARALPSGLREGAIAGDIGDALPAMLFARSDSHRRRLLDALGNWAPAEDLRAALQRALHDEDVACRLTAAESIARVFKADESVGRYCWHLAMQGTDNRLRQSGLVAAVNWPTLGDIDALLADAESEPDPTLMVCVLKIRIASNKHASDAWKILWRLSGLGSLLPFDLKWQIPDLIKQGWPGSTDIRDAALARVLRSRYDDEDGLSFETAAGLLLSGYPGDPAVGQWLVSAMRDPHGIPLFLFRADIAGFKGTPGLDGVLLDWMRREDHWIATRLHEWVGVASSRDIQDFLKEKFAHAHGLEAYWLAAALLASWSEDSDVVGLVRTWLLERPPREAGYLAWHARAVIPDAQERRALLLRWLRDPDVARPDAVIDEALNLPHAAHDEELVNEVVQRLDHEPLNMYARKAILSRMLAAVPTRDPVRRAALQELDDPEAPLEELAGAYQNDSEFRSRLLTASQACDLDVRQVLVSRMRPPISRQVDYRRLFSGVWVETESGIRIHGVLALARFVGAGSDRENLLARLRREALVLGTHYVERRRASVAGILGLRAEQMLASITDVRGGALKIDLHHRPGEDVEPLVRLLLTDWPKHRALIGPEQPIQIAWNDFWTLAEPLFDEYPEAVTDAEVHLREHRGPASAGLIRAISRVLPRSSVLLGTCLETIGRYQTALPDALHAARTLGDHFTGNADVEARLDEIRRAADPWDSSMWAVALAYGWSESPILREAFTPGQRVSQVVFIHLDRVLNQGSRHIAALEGIVQKGHEGNGDNVYVIAEIVESFRRCTSSDASFPERLIP